MTVRFFVSILSMVLALGHGASAQGEDPPAPETAQPQTAAPGSGENGTEKPASAEAKPSEPEKPRPKPGELQMATFGGGCFWCIEAVFDQVPGVRMAVSGYAGGVVPAPTYEMVSTGTTGHAEVVQVVFEPAFVSYEKLLEIFWRSHNPTTPNAQGPDSGPQYRSIILYHNEDQKKAAEKVYKALKARKVLKGQVVTQLVPFTGFYPAEAYHQDYYFNHPLETYSMIYIAPKFDVYRKMGMLARQRPRKK